MVGDTMNRQCSWSLQSVTDLLELLVPNALIRTTNHDQYSLRILTSGFGAPWRHLRSIYSFISLNVVCLCTSLSSTFAFASSVLMSLFSWVSDLFIIWYSIRLSWSTSLYHESSLFSWASFSGIFWNDLITMIGNESKIEIGGTACTLFFLRPANILINQLTLRKPALSHWMVLLKRFRYISVVEYSKF